MKHLFRLNVEDPTKFNIGSYNPTCKAIIKSLYKMHKAGIESATGDRILEYAVENRLWSTTQKPELYHTTWSYYWHKKFKFETTIVKVGEVEGDDDVEMLEEEALELE